MTKYKLENGMRQCSSCGNVYPDTDEYFYKYPGKTMAKCKKCTSARMNKNIKKRRENDPEFAEVVRNRSRKWYFNNQRLKIEKSRNWQFENIEKKRSIDRKSQSNRNAKKKGLPNTLTQSEIEFALEYFNYKCAYCGTNLENGFHLDHFIPLKNENCPGTIAQNILPVCAHCNHTKHASDPQIWLIRKFGNSIALEILEKLKLYFEVLKVETQSTKD